MCSSRTGIAQSEVLSESENQPFCHPAVAATYYVPGSGFPVRIYCIRISAYVSTFFMGSIMRLPVACSKFPVFCERCVVGCFFFPMSCARLSYYYSSLILGNLNVADLKTV